LAKNLGFTARINISSEEDNEEAIEKCRKVKAKVVPVLN
jgi:hypothetical protein